MLASRRTTINHMFAAAIAPHDDFDEHRVREAVALLGNDPDGNLECAYCGKPAETWDHVFATVKDSRFSGHGHRLGNLLPCCKPCNSRKGNKHWQSHLAALPLDETDRSDRFVAIQHYLDSFLRTDDQGEQTEAHQRLEEIRIQILALMSEADEVAVRGSGPRCAAQPVARPSRIG
jgi:hypothetical protein